MNCDDSSQLPLVSDGFSKARGGNNDFKLEWALGFKSGDMNAFESIYQFESVRLFRYISKVVPFHEAVEDIFQEVWIEAWQHHARLRKPEFFLSWLYGITRQCIAGYYRKHNRKLKIQLFEDTEIPEDSVNRIQDTSPGADYVARTNEWRQVFDQELSLLDIVSQEIITYRFIAGMSITDIAKCMDLPITTVSSKLHRSLRKIKLSLDNKGVEYPF